MAAETINVDTNSSKVKVTEVTKVKPHHHHHTLAGGNVSETAPFVLPLTRFDLFLFPILPPVERLFFYEAPGLTRDSFHSAILPQLKWSLSLTLLHYRPLAGNIMWPPHANKPAVYFFPDADEGDDDGVSFTVAECDSDANNFNHLSGNGIRSAVEFRPLVSCLSVSDDKAEVLSVQITLFPNQGYTIGITTSHAVLDGQSSTLFVKSWACLCKQLQSSCHDQELDQHLNLSSVSLSPELTPFFDRGVIKDQPGGHVPSLKSLAKPSSVDLNNLVRVTFEMTREDIQRLREQILNEMERSSNYKELRLSTFVVTFAYAFVRMVRAKIDRHSDINNKDVMVIFAADLRARLDPPVPVNYVGNCLKAYGDLAKVSDVLQENGLAFAAEMISDLVEEVAEDDGSVLLDGKMARALEAVRKGGGELRLSVAGSTRFGVYESDFGWGCPKKVEIVSIDRHYAVSFAESKEGGGGVELGFVLEKQQMEIFASLFNNGLGK